MDVMRMETIPSTVSIRYVKLLETFKGFANRARQGMYGTVVTFLDGTPEEVLALRAFATTLHFVFSPFLSEDGIRGRMVVVRKDPALQGREEVIGEVHFKPNGVLIGFTHSDGDTFDISWCTVNLIEHFLILALNNPPRY